MEESAERAKGSGNSIVGDNGNGNGNGKGKTKKEEQEKHVLEIHDGVLKRLRETNQPEFMVDKFDGDLWVHFHRLPARYAMDVSVERADDILIHMKLLEDAKNPLTEPPFSVKVVRVSMDEEDNEPTGPNRKNIRDLPSFGSSYNLRQLARRASMSQANDDENDSNPVTFFRPVHEITFATENKPKVLNKITELLSDLDLNIQEAHAFSTNDGFSLDVFVVVGWHYEETEQLTEAISKELNKMAMQKGQSSPPWSPELDKSDECDDNAQLVSTDRIKVPTDETSEWEIDAKKLVFGNKFAAGTYGDLYRGSFYGQDVAIKVIKHDRLNESMKKEFDQEVSIMKKVRHKNVVQFLGACTKPPRFFIVTEFMSGGSLYDYLHKHKGALKPQFLLKISLDIAKGMDYLHQHKIIHRDLKTANLLIDENEVVKVADFGVAKVINSPGIMTAETGTYRWMAPEVIEHKAYNHKADVFSFGVVLWELLTAKIPYEYLTPLQAAIGVVQKAIRPTIPKGTNPKFAEIMEKCWQQDPCKRPDFATVVQVLQHISDELGMKPEENNKGGIFSILRKGLAS
ncbi:hypothetical protein LUZ60_007088 [Juncus effusus]|nr:hypothetical protein LUZ60_007088 [Juncus effusus]